MTQAPGLSVLVMELGPLAANAYLVVDPATSRALVIDPGDDAHLILGEIGERRLVVDKILLTHGHFDHVGAVKAVRERTKAPVYVHEADAERMRTARRQGLLFGLSVTDPPTPDVLVKDGDRIPFGDREFLVIHTPGHTPGCVCFLEGKTAFVGDLIFAGSIGRTDLPGGSHEDLIASIETKIFTLPDDTVLFPGHGPATTVGDERRHNPFFA